MSQHPTDEFRTSCAAAAPLELNVLGPGGAGGKRRIFEHPFVLVGRDERSCLRLEDAAVSRQHAYLQQFGGRIFCVDLGSRTGIRWGGERRPAGWLRPGQGIQIGPFTLELATAARTGEEPGHWVANDWDPLQERASDTQFLPQVTAEVGNEVLARIRMNRVMVLVGSSPACKIRLRDARVSRYHCSLLRTPQGVWVIDLLHGIGACVNGQSLRCALMKDGDRLQVGPYVLRVWYPDARTETPPPRLVEIPAVTLVQPADDTSESARPSQDQHRLEGAATSVSVLVSALQADLDQPRERQPDAEVLRQQLADSQAECDRLREQARAVEVQIVGMADLQTRLDAAEVNARELVLVRGERDRCLAEVQNLQARLAANAADQEQLGRLAEDLHAVEVERDRLQTEQQTCRHSAEEALARVSDLERALTEAAAAHQTALEQTRVGWESERQALEAHLEQQRQSHHGAVQAAIGEVHAEVAAERKEWEQRLEAAQNQLVEEREGVRAAGARLEQESVTLEKVRADLAAREAEHGAALQRLQEAQDELALSQDEARGLQSRLDQALERQPDVEALRRQLADTRAEHAQLCASVPALEGRAHSADRLWARLRGAGAETERLRVQLRAAESREAKLEAMRAECEWLREQARALEVQVVGMADLQTRLDAAEASARELDVVRGERDCCLAEVQNLQARLAANAADQEQLGRLAEDLHAVEVERDRLQTEQQTCRHSAEEALARVSDLERALTEAAAAHQTALEQTRVGWESERQALEAHLEQQRQSHHGAVQAAIGEVHAEVAAERKEWEQRLEAAQNQLVEERGAFQAQNEQLRQQAVSLHMERNRLAAQLAQTELRLRAAEEHSMAELQQLLQQAARDQVFIQLAGLRR